MNQQKATKKSKGFLDFVTFVGVIIGIITGFIGIAFIINPKLQTQLIGAGLITIGLALSFVSGFANHKLNKEN